MQLSRHSLPVFSRPDKDVPGVRAEDDSDPRVDPEDVLGQAALPSEGGGDSDAAEIRKALDNRCGRAKLGWPQPIHASRQ